MRSPSVLTAFEHAGLSIGEAGSADVTPVEAQVLMDVGRERAGFVTRGHRSIRLNQFVGLVNMHGRVLEVLPKVGATDDAGTCRGTLLRMLRLAHHLPPFEHGLAGHDLQRGHLLEVFIAAYLQAVGQIVRSGLTRRYRSVEEDIGVVRGRLMIARQAKVHAMRPDRLSCRFDELAVDNPWNQIIKAALLVVRPWTRSVEGSRRWLELAAAFDEVSVCSDPLTLFETLTVDRQVQHYWRALQWAGWILRLLSPNLRGGRSQAPELLFDMNRVFEAAVASRLKGKARGFGVQVASQQAGRSLAVVDSDHARPYFGLRPDLVIRDGARIVAVADTKWKRIDCDGVGHIIPPDGDVYQLNAYGSVYPCEELVLIYPWHAGLDLAKPTAFRLPERAGRSPLLHVLAIDVGDDDLVPRPACASKIGSLLA